ncbi:MAG: hypothetical protein ACOX7H_08825 [Bacillota bacterium]
MNWKQEAEKLKFDKGLSWTEVARKLSHYFPDLDEKQVWEKVRTALRRSKRYETKGKITFEDKKEPTIEDIDEYYNQLKRMNKVIMQLESKQTVANISIDDTKPIGLAFWGDWHLGAKGVDYEQHDIDTELIAKTDGLYVIGMGDYKDNANAFVHPASTYEDIATTDMQDKIVQRIFDRTADKHIVTIRGCHDDWDKRNSNKDFVQSLCDITGAVNLWHGGIINLTVGQEEYRIGARHKYKNESGLNTTNTQRNFINEFGHCDIVAVAHKHFAELQHTRRMGEETIYLRSGTYKQYDEFGQKLAGYEGAYGVPVVILMPDRHEMIPVRNLELAAEFLDKLR